MPFVSVQAVLLPEMSFEDSHVVAKDTAYSKVPLIWTDTMTSNIPQSLHRPHEVPTKTAFR